MEDIRIGMYALPINFPGTGFWHAVKASRAICEKFRVLVRQRRIDISEKRANITQDILSVNFKINSTIFYC